MPAYIKIGDIANQNPQNIKSAMNNQMSAKVDEVKQDHQNRAVADAVQLSDAARSSAMDAASPGLNLDSANSGLDAATPGLINGDPDRPMLEGKGNDVRTNIDLHG